ncbi:MAG TPA: hypothetical protein DCY72_06070 [Ruminococcaceae bacterium]|nr:hypothetical protein [Oscillospiraceae bacterium]
MNRSSIDGSAFITSIDEIKILLRKLSGTPLTARFVPASEGDERVVVLEECFSELTAVLSSRCDFPRVSEDQLFELSFGELMVLIDDYLTYAPRNNDMLLRGTNDALVIVRCLTNILKREVFFEEPDLMPDEMLPYCGLISWKTAFYALSTPIGRLLYDLHFRETRRLLSGENIHLAEGRVVRLNDILHTISELLAQGPAERDAGIWLMLHLIVWPITIYEKNIRGVTSSDVREKLKR